MSLANGQHEVRKVKKEEPPGTALLHQLSHRFEAHLHTPVGARRGGGSAQWPVGEFVFVLNYILLPAENPCKKTTEKILPRSFWPQLLGSGFHE